MGSGRAIGDRPEFEPRYLVLAAPVTDLFTPDGAAETPSAGYSSSPPSLSSYWHVIPLNSNIPGVLDLSQVTVTCRTCAR
jgi:hypothetical protein